MKQDLSPSKIEEDFLAAATEVKSPLIVDVEELIPGILPEPTKKEQFDIYVPDWWFFEPYARTLTESLPGAKHDNCELVKKGLRGQVVVDLGAGHAAWGYFIANYFDAAGWVGIEPTREVIESVKPMFEKLTGDPRGLDGK